MYLSVCIFDVDFMIPYINMVNLIFLFVNNNRLTSMKTTTTTSTMTMTMTLTALKLADNTMWSLTVRHRSMQYVHRKWICQAWYTDWLTDWLMAIFFVFILPWYWALFVCVCLFRLFMYWLTGSSNQVCKHVSDINFVVCFLILRVKAFDWWFFIHTLGEGKKSRRSERHWENNSFSVNQGWILPTNLLASG